MFVVKFNINTDIIPVKLGQAYTQPEDFTNGTTNHDNNAPANGFNFINKASAAAAVVYKKIQGRYSAIYISQKAPLPPGIETLIPKLKVAVWFSSDAETEKMISTFSGTPWIVDLTQNQSHTAEIKYDATGNWATVNNN